MPDVPLPLRARRRWLIFLSVALVSSGAALWAKQRMLGSAPLPLPNGKRLDLPAPLAVWPWPAKFQARSETTHHGVTHWLAYSPDGTSVDLFDFDFQSNPGLKWEIFDQDEDDAKPFDNRVEWWPRGVAQITRQLNAQKRGPIVAAWNGAFFGYDRKSNSRIAFHVSPVVLKGQAHYAKPNHRWTFGVKYVGGKPQWKVFHLPDASLLAREFDWAAGSVQCLIKDGAPLKLQPFPRAGDKPLPQPYPSTPQDAGHIPDFDHMKSTRASLAWSRDNRHLYLLFVKETDTESASIVALRHGLPMGGGWMVSDLQNFWQSFGRAHPIWCAVNSDAGDAGQLAYARPNDYQLLPARLASGVMRMPIPAQNAPQGGTIMTFFVRDTLSTAIHEP